MSETGYVYTLSDPRTGEPKYVGASKEPKRRLTEHKNGNTNEDVTEWVQDLEKVGESPNMHIVTVAPLDELSEKAQQVVERLNSDRELYNDEHYRPYTAGDGETPDTSIPIEGAVRDELRGEKRGNETYTQVIERLLESQAQAIDLCNQWERVRGENDIERSVYDNCAFELREVVEDD